MTSFIYTAGMRSTTQYHDQQPLLRRIYGAVICFAVLCFAVLRFLLGRPYEPWHSALVLLPCVPLGLMVFWFLRWAEHMDELKRRVFLEAIAFSAILTAFLTFCYGFLQSVGWPAMRGWYVWGLMGPLWLVGLVRAKRKYE